MNKAVRAMVFARDGGCVAPMLDANAGPCGPNYGLMWVPRAMVPEHERWLEYNHVHLTYGRAGLRAEDDVRQGVTLCAFHHRGTRAGSNWEAKERNRERTYLLTLYPNGTRGAITPEDAMRYVRQIFDLGS